MDVGQDMSGNDTENVAGEIDNAGEPKEMMNESNSHESEGQGNQDDASFDRKRLEIEKRLKQQRRSHEREIREMQARMEYLQSQLPPQSTEPQQSSYSNQNGGIDETIHKAISIALQQKEMEERKAREAQAQQHIAKQYQELNKHLDSTADKYDDFDEVVRGDSPFTAHMRDAALMLPKKGLGSAGEVLYRLGKNPEELSRIAKLHPVDQAAELVALSHALISGGEQKGNAPRPLGQIKSNPVVNSVGITDKTPISDIRDRMKKGVFK